MEQIHQKVLISQTQNGKIRILREEYTSVQVRFVVENEKYFNSHQNFFQAMKEFNELSKHDQKYSENKKQNKILEVN